MTEQLRADAELLRLQLLVLRCQAGGGDAFRRLFDEFAPRTLRYLRGLVGEQAEDVQQEVWLTVFRNICDLHNPAAFRTWLYQTTRHRAIDYLRRMRREGELLDELVADQIGATTTSAPDPAAFDDQTIAAMDSLPAAQREVLLLRYRDQLTYEEIARIVGRPIGTVRTRLHHARRKLGALLQKGRT